MHPDAAPGPSPDRVPETRPRAAGPFRRRPALLLALVLDGLVAVATAWALANGFQPIVIAFAVILGIAPWAAIIDDAERPPRR